LIQLSKEKETEMKTFSILIILIMLFAGCTNNNKPLTGTENIGNGVLSSGTSGRSDSGAISVVRPLLIKKIITVGGSNADIKGFTNEAIQVAIDAIRDAGTGGKVFLSPGNFDIIAPVRLYDNTILEGSGPGTVLKKCKGYTSPFAIDADYGELKITVKDASGFRPGMGVAIYDDAQRSGWDLTTAKILDIRGNTLYIDNILLRDYSISKKGAVSNACSVISAVEAENVTISNLAVDGSGDTNEMIDGCRAGGVYLHMVMNALVENVIVRNFNCDGISWQITEYVTVRNCEVSGCKNNGLHPGTGSPFTVIEGCNSHNNGGSGLFVCWRVRDGLVSNNKLHNNYANGISTGHKDTAMVFAGNQIYENGSDGIHLRGETDLNAPHGSIFRENTIENNGMREEAYGISINSKAKGVVIENNIIRNTGKGKQVGALLLTNNSLPVVMKNNNISGHSKGEIIKE
jgi:hypothetical protein